MDSDWPQALLIFGAACLFWVVALMTPVGAAALDLLLRINSVGL